jgi:hypothetical protein
MFPAGKIDVYAIRGSLHKAEDAHPVAGDHVAILATCRTIYSEAKPVLYANTEFCIHLKDGYWLHFWTSEKYLDTFEVRDEGVAPGADDWIEHNPWLENPCSIVPINNVRVLTLDIQANASAEGRRSTWTGQLKHTLREARQIEKLHLTIDCDNDWSFSQDETNDTLRIVGQIVRCGGTVTGNMGLSLGSEGFASAGYYEMLAGLKG